MSTSPPTKIMRAIIQRAFRRRPHDKLISDFKEMQGKAAVGGRGEGGLQRCLSGVTKQGPKAISQPTNSSARVWRSGHKTNPSRPRRQEEAANGLISPPLTGLIPPFSSGRNIHSYWEAQTGGVGGGVGGPCGKHRTNRQLKPVPCVKYPTSSIIS